MESEVYKLSMSNRHSGIYYGPITAVYGFGIVVLIIYKKYVLDRIKCNRLLKLIITYVSCVIILTLIEFLGGNISHILFNIDMWDYSLKKYNLGKYICLDLALIWGVLGTFYIYYLKDFIDKIIRLIPKYVTYIFIFIYIIDLGLVFIKK